MNHNRDRPSDVQILPADAGTARDRSGRTTYESNVGADRVWPRYVQLAHANTTRIG
jgi:hypothetical protein